MKKLIVKIYDKDCRKLIILLQKNMKKKYYYINLSLYTDIDLPIIY